ncbi:MAG TPA: dipicolinate synthase subunit B [Pseudogracilibacillus sp.]|nr:dipicolinate synthase subunit B [Pseudogracilibacillus sp.]
MKKLRIGFAITGSFCNYDVVFKEIEKLAKREDIELFPIMSYAANSFDTRFGKSADWNKKLEDLTGNKIINTIVDAEPVGPELNFDLIVVAPCTGNTTAKLANAITDTPVTMACKAQLRNQKPIVLAIATNDGLGANGKNIGLLLNMKNVYFVPFTQDDPKGKPNSLVADFTLIEQTIEATLHGKQLQPVLL